MKIIFFDTETTGNGPNDRLVSLAVKARGEGAPTLDALYKPPVPIPIEAMAIHHITPKMVAHKPAFKESAEFDDTKSLFEDHDTLAVAHNAAFDLAMLAKEGVVPAATICTLKVASALDREKKIPSYRLQYLRYALGIELEAVAHSAIGDVLVLEQLFERLLTKMVEEKGSEEAALAEMITISKQPIMMHAFHFGKHNGKKVEEVAKTDRGYLEWLLSQKKQNPLNEEDWIYTLEYHLNNHKG